MVAEGWEEAGAAVTSCGHGVSLRGDAEVLPLRWWFRRAHEACRRTARFKMVYFMSREFSLQFSKAAGEVWDDWKPRNVRCSAAGNVRAGGCGSPGNPGAARDAWG